MADDDQGRMIDQSDAFEEFVGVNRAAVGFGGVGLQFVLESALNLCPHCGVGCRAEPTESVCGLRVRLCRRGERKQNREEKSGR